MTAQTQENHRPQPQLDHWAWGDTPDPLADIAQDAVNLTVWERPEQRALTAAVDVLVAARPAFRFQESGTPDELLRALTEQLSGLGSVQALTEDVHLLADMMSCLFDHEHIGISPHAVALCKGDGWPGNAGVGSFIDHPNRSRTRRAYY